MLFDYRTLRAYAPFVYIASVIGLIAVLVVGTEVNGAQAWIMLPGGFSIQPSEFMKVALCVGLAMLLAERRDAETEPQLPDVGFALLIAAVPIGLVMLQPDLGTAVVMGVIVLGILAIAGTKLSWLAGSLRVVYSAPPSRSRSAFSTSTRSIDCWRSRIPRSIRKVSATTPIRRASQSGPVASGALVCFRGPKPVRVRP